MSVLVEHLLPIQLFGHQKRTQRVNLLKQTQKISGIA